MRKGKQPQRKVHLPQDWWLRLIGLCRSQWQQPGTRLDIYDFTRISRRSFASARRSNQITEQLFLRLTEAVGYSDHEDLLRVLGTKNQPVAGTQGLIPAIAAPVEMPPDKPSIAVMPFQNLTGDLGQEYFVDGMVEAIITALGRIRWLFVIARNSTFTYKGQAIDAKRVGQELGVRYLLEGSIQKGAGRMRITARLINAETGGVDLWADHFDGSLENVFDLQDKVASSVAGVIEPELQAAESVRSAGRRTADKTAYDLYLLAHARAMSWAQQIREAIDLFEQAIERDPCYGPALAWTAYGYYRLLLDELSENRDADRIKSANLARRALEMGGDDPEVLANAALVLAYFGEDIGAMLALVDQALSRSPSFARGWHISGILRVWAGEPDIAIEHLETALRLSPRSVGTTRFVIGAANFFARRFGEAAPKLRVAIHQIPRFPEPYRILAACCAHMGRLEEARDVVGRLRALGVPLISDITYLRNIEQRELLVSGMRLATREEQKLVLMC